MGDVATGRYMQRLAVAHRYQTKAEAHGTAVVKMRGVASSEDGTVFDMNDIVSSPTPVRR